MLFVAYGIIVDIIYMDTKDRLRIHTGQVSSEVNRCIRTFSRQKGCEVVVLNAQIDHVHLLGMILPMISIFDLMRMKA